MKQSFIYALPLLGAAAARPEVWSLNAKREVPQEHAHRNVNLEVSKSLNLNNPDKIQDPIFGLLGAAAGIKGAGNIKDADCLQQATADQAFTNAKAANDVNGMTFALIFRALERNTGSVGLASVPCTSITAVNPEIAALQQHQDPASDGAAALNKQIATELVKQIAAVGGDTSLANEASTFAPGTIGDTTGAGNTCDDATDDAGCINTLKLRVDDLTAAEIQAAASGASTANSTAAATNGTQNANTGNNNKNSNKGNKQNNNAASNANNNAASSANTNALSDAVSQLLGGNNNANANANSNNLLSSVLGGNNAASSLLSSGNNLASSLVGGASSRSSGILRRQANDFGSCTDPSVTFGIPSDGRKEQAFEPTDLTDFNHGSALNIGVISAFICDQLTNKCKASAAAVTKCDSADAAVKASGLTGQAAADSFNQALGV